MKLFRKEEMQQLEAAAGEAGVGLSLLMENAGAALYREAEDRLGPLYGKRAVLLCGAGNNGGDGFVCARRLWEQGAACTVVLAQGGPKTDLARAAYASLPQGVERLDWAVQKEEVRRAVGQAEILFDCVFGFGFRGALPEEIEKLLRLANERTNCLKIAADLPSGVECDTARVSKGAFCANVTVAFTGKKPAGCSYPAKEYCGETVVRPVGVPQALEQAAETRMTETDAAFVRGALTDPDPQANKGDLGRLLLVCGSCGMAGACIMAARAALRAGVGLLTVAVEESIYPIVAQAVPEAVLLPLNWKTEPEESEARLLSALSKCTACLIGCGLGSLADTVCPIVMEHCTAPLVVDADGLNFCARRPEALEHCSAPMILTPHPGEMARLCGDDIPEIQADRLSVAARKARDTGAVVVLKGAATVTAGPDGRCAVNPTGNAGMAKGGSGDVLAGVTASLAAQGVPCFEAAAAAVYVHGLAGDLCAAELGMRSMLPTDLIEALPDAFQAE